MYGHIGVRKKFLLNRLMVIHSALERSNSEKLRDIELQVREELESVLHHEELLWKQKSRCDWLNLGDRNTKFFHDRTLRRRKLNRISALHINDGDWCYDSDILQEEAISFFQNPYGGDPTPLINLPPNSFPILDPIDIDFLGKVVSNMRLRKLCLIWPL